MNSRTTKTFWKLFDALPREAQRQGVRETPSVDLDAMGATPKAALDLMVMSQGTDYPHRNEAGSRQYVFFLSGALATARGQHRR